MNFNKESPPKLFLNGSHSIVPDKPWILNRTLKENILLDQPFNEEKYKNSLKMSCLDQDI